MPTDDARWDSDDRGHGVADGQGFVPFLDELRETLQRQNWVAEEPSLHLLPRLQRWCDRPGSALRLCHAASTEDGVFEVELVQQRALSAAGLRQEVFGVLGSVAEGASFVYERDQAGRTLFEIATGLLDQQTHFNSHGHTIRFVIARSEEM